MPRLLTFSAQEFIPKLKRYLFPRIIAALIEEVSLNPDCYPTSCLPLLKAAFSSEPLEGDLDGIYIHSDTIYRHNVFQVRYTTYDCHQDTDTINPKTSRRDFMCLPAQDEADEGGPSENLEPKDYIYGRLLGIFHANVVYGGSGALDYRQR